MLIYLVIHSKIVMEANNIFSFFERLYAPLALALTQVDLGVVTTIFGDQP